MRDENRIKPFLEEIEKAWEKHPDMRFGQFICNILGEMQSKHGDPFFYEEDKFLEYMKEIEWLKN